MYGITAFLFAATVHLTPCLQNAKVVSSNAAIPACLHRCHTHASVEISLLLLTAHPQARMEGSIT